MLFDMTQAEIIYDLPVCLQIFLFFCNILKQNVKYIKSNVFAEFSIGPVYTPHSDVGQARACLCVNQCAHWSLNGCRCNRGVESEVISLMLFLLNSLRHKDSVGGLPLHHHTVHLGGEISSCAHCMQSHVLKTRRRSRVSRSRARPGEQTVFSVGR